MLDLKRSITATKTEISNNKALIKRYAKDPNKVVQLETKGAELQSRLNVAVDKLTALQKSKK